jgi:hypothetical protein
MMDNKERKSNELAQMSLEGRREEIKKERESEWCSYLIDVNASELERRLRSDQLVSL